MAASTLFFVSRQFFGSNVPHSVSLHSHGLPVHWLATWISFAVQVETPLW